jgi:hypothetical protein
MTPPAEAFPRKSRLAALLEHCSQAEDPRSVRRIPHPLPEVLFLVVCGSIADCDDYEDIAAWGARRVSTSSASPCPTRTASNAGWPSG